MFVKRDSNGRTFRDVAFVAFLGFAMSLCGPGAANSQRKAAANEKNKVMALNLEVVTPHEEAELKEFVAQLTKSLWRNWLALMPESAMLGDSAIVVIRFQIGKDRSQPVAPPIVEQGAGDKMKSLTNAALAAIREAKKSSRFPNTFPGPSVELRATFLYNQPADSVKK